MMNLRSLAMVSLVALASIPAAGCGGPQESKTASVKVGDMPDGESWTGVYFHPVFGYLHLVEEDQNVVGKWVKTDKGAAGQLSGSKQGNVLRFSWSEHPCGGGAGLHKAKGKGVFVYKMGPNGIAELDGQYGLEDSEVGSDWHNVKQQRQQADLASANCPGGDAPMTGGLE
jgi:hypothetical protein